MVAMFELGTEGHEALASLPELSLRLWEKSTDAMLSDLEALRKVCCELPQHQSARSLHA